MLGIPVAVVALAGNAAAQVYALATNPQGSVFYSTGASIAKLMVEKTGLQFRIAPYAGSSTYIPLINRGQIAFGLVNAGEAAFAMAEARYSRGARIRRCARCWCPSRTTAASRSR